MYRLTEHDKWLVRELLLYGTYPVQWFERASRKEQTYGVAVVAHEGARAARGAIICGLPGVLLLLASLLLSDTPTALIVAGFLLCSAALVAVLAAWRCRSTIRRLHNAQLLTPGQIALDRRLAKGGSLSTFASPPPQGGRARSKHEVQAPGASEQVVRREQLDAGNLVGAEWACVIGPVGAGKSAILQSVAREGVQEGRVVIALDLLPSARDPLRADEPSDYVATGAEAFFDFEEFQRRIEGLLSQHPDRRLLAIVDGIGLRSDTIALGQWANRATRPDQLQLICTTNSPSIPLVRELGTRVKTIIALDAPRTKGRVTGTVARSPEFLDTPWEIALPPESEASPKAATTEDTARPHHSPTTDRRN